jgi:hypothetical protein
MFMEEACFVGHAMQVAGCLIHNVGLWRMQMGERNVVIVRHM